MKVNKVFIVVISIVALYFVLSAFNNNKEGTNQNKIYGTSDETVTDYDGNVYHTVKIGTQIWMLENLKVTHYRNGIAIPNVSVNEKWSTASTGAYCLVNNDSAEYKQIFGVLYNFYAVNNKNKLCPVGWHIPTESECMTLINYLGGKEIAGGKIKDNSSNLWKSKDTYATNESGFSGFPAGGRGRLGSADDVGYYATWWSSTSYDSLYAWHWGLYPDKESIRSNPGHKASGFSVRCIKDG
jgi:uncharacterized protein (TIGR02145 family)